MKAIDRIYQYFDYKNIKPTRFEKDFGFSNGYFGTQLRRKADLGESVLLKIIENCLEIDVEWLITGNGSMLKENDVSTVNEPQSTYETDKDEIIALLKGRIADKEEIIERLKTELDHYKEKYEGKKPSKQRAS